MNFDFSELYAQSGIKRIGEINPYITMSCDLRCSYCYVFNQLVRAKDRTNQMQTDFLLGLTDHLIGESGGLDKVILLGGEPTLHPDITTIATEMSGRDIRVRRMTSNGMGLHYLNVGKLSPTTFDYVSLSIDSTETNTNRINRGGSYSKILEAMEAYRDAGIPLCINVTVTNANLNEMCNVIPFFYEKGARVITYHRASLDGNAYNNRELMVSAKDWVVNRDKVIAFTKQNAKQFPDLQIRMPYIYLQPEQVERLQYKPVQESSYNCPDGGHRLIVFPPTDKGQGLCYMSADVIGQEGAELGRIDALGKFTWNADPRNEYTVYKNTKSADVSSAIKGEDGDDVESGLIRVVNSFKTVLNTSQLVRQRQLVAVP